jgi:predicted permease
VREDRRPPLAARWLIRASVPEPNREFVSGDLDELYARRHLTHGDRAARRWYWQQSVRCALARWPRPSPREPRQGDRLMSALAQDLRFAIRTYAKAPALTGIVILTLALGIGVNATVFSWISATLLNPIPGAAEPGRLVELGLTYDDELQSLSYPQFTEYRAAVRQLSGLAVRDDVAVNVMFDGRAERAWGEIVSGNFFDVLGVTPALGRAFTADEDRTPGRAAVVVISDGFWRRQFAADPQIIGRTLTINNHSFTIVGVAPAGFQGSSTGLALDLWVPLMMQAVIVPGGDRLAHAGNRWLAAIGRLAPGAAVEQARAEFEAVIRRLEPVFSFTRDTHAGVYLMAESPRGGMAVLRPVLTALGGVVGFVLLIACANVAGLLLARAAARRREIAIRLSLGASRRRILRQLLTEGVLLALVASAAALVITRWTSQLLLRLAPPTDLPVGLPILVDARVIAFTLVAGLVAGVLFAVAPALQSAATDHLAALKSESGGAAGSRRRTRLRSALVVVQVALSVILLVSALLAIRSVRNAQQARPGFQTDGVLLAGLDLFPSGYDADTGRRFARDLFEGLRAIPGARSVTFARRVPLGFVGTSAANVRIEGYAPRPDEPMSVNYNHVGPDYFRTMGTTLLAGRDVTVADDREAPRVAVISRAMARRYWGDRNPMGARLRLAGGDWITIVGVAEDVKYRSLGERPRAFVYLPVLQFYNSEMVIHVRTDGDPAALAAPVRGVVQRLDPGLPLYGVRTLAEHVEAASFQQRLAGAVLTVFGGLALALAAVGIYGIVAYGVSQRRREIGIRVALGAEAGAVVGLVLRHGLRATLAGIAVGIAGALATTRALASILYGVDPRDPLSFTLVALLLLSTALLACWYPARTAVRIDPAVTLRSE